MTSKSTEFRFQHILLGRDSLAIVLTQVGAWSNKDFDVLSVFKDFVKQNSVCFWNQCLVQSVKNLTFRGWIVPMTVLVGGSDFALEVVRSAWARRVLRPPKGYIICKLGDISILELHPVLQTQFAPLSEALCKVVVELNSENVAATATSVASKLQEFFPKMEVPSEDILYKTLGGLIRERKLYHTGEGYFIVSPDTYRQRALSPLCERQMLMTNEEAIVRLHGDQRERSLAVQVDESDIAASSWQCSSSPNSTMKQDYAFSSQHSSPINNSASPTTDLRVVERSHSLRVLRVKGKASATREIFGRYGSFKDHTNNKKDKFPPANENESCDRQRCEKQSMLSRLFRRMQSLTEKSNKHGTFSAQFPPLEWFGSEQLHCHSVATQTQLQFRKFQSKPNNKKPVCLEAEPIKITWPQPDHRDNNTSQNLCKILNKGLPMESETHFVHKKTNFCPRPSVSKYSPSQRHSYATFNHHTKRHYYKHRRSSSESPKSDKTKKNEVGLLYERKVDNIQNPLGSRTSNPKAIISPCSIVYKQTTPLPLNFNSVDVAPSPSINIDISSPISMDKANTSTPVTDSSNGVMVNFPKSVSLVNQANSFNLTPKKRTKIQEKATILRESHSRSNSISSSELKLSMSESNSEPPVFTRDKKLYKNTESSEQMAIDAKEETFKIVNDSTPLKNSTSTKEILIDNSINVEVAVEKKNPKIKSNNVSTTVSQTVTEETTVKKGSGKVVTVTSVTTSLTHGSAKDIEKHCQEINLSDVDKTMEKEDIQKVNDLNVESKNNPCVIDCSSSCNIITELK